MVLTAHRWFANKSCPGDWLYSRYGELANRINALLGSGGSSGGTSGSGSGSTSSSSGLYYVQSGAYSKKENADTQAAKLKAKGFEVLIKKNGNLYKVQTGAYSKKVNADAQAAKLKAAGFDAFVTTEGGTSAGSSEIKIGDVVQFAGGPHYTSANASSYSTTPKAGPAKVTAISKGAKHPYHIIHTTSASSVYGWVDADKITK